MSMQILLNPALAGVVFLVLLTLWTLLILVSTKITLQFFQHLSRLLVGSSQRRTDIVMPSSTTARTVATSLELDKIMAKIENDNKVLAELDKNRSTIGKRLLENV